MAYLECKRLTGSPACGDKVTDMSYAYRACWGLTGSPVCGPNVTNMRSAYEYCDNMTGSPVCGPNVTDMKSAYGGCNKLSGNVYIYSNNVANATDAFYDCPISKIYVHPNTTSWNAFVSAGYSSKMVAF